MRKEEFIAEYGKAAYEKKAELHRKYIMKWRKKNPKKVIESNRKSHKLCHERNPEKRIVAARETSRKGGIYYNWKLEYQRTGIPGERARIRHQHGRRWSQYKKVIAHNSQIHHEWIPGTAKYNGVALVEKDQHMHGFIDVIKILEGKITVYIEKTLTS